MSLFSVCEFCVCLIELCLPIVCFGLGFCDWCVSYLFFLVYRFIGLGCHFNGLTTRKWFFVNANIRVSIATINIRLHVLSTDAGRCIRTVRVRCHFSKKRSKFIIVVFLTICFVRRRRITDVYSKSTSCRILVLFQMTIQVGLLAEALLAQMTPEWTFLVVNVSDVTLQIAGNAERSFAVLALVGLFSSVGA